MVTLDFPVTKLQIIKNLIPHREPMILISEVLSYFQGMITTSYTVTENCVFLKNDIFTEAGIIEHMAQTAAAMNGLQSDSSKEPSAGYLVAINNFKLKRCPNIRERIVSTAVESFTFNGLSRFKTEIKIGDNIIATAELTTTLNNSLD